MWSLLFEAFVVLVLKSVFSLEPPTTPEEERMGWGRDSPKEREELKTVMVQAGSLVGNPSS